MQPNTHDLLCDKYFEITQYGGMYQQDQRNVGQLLKKKNPFGKVTHTLFRPNLCNFLSYYLLFEDFCEMLQHEKIQQVYNSNSQLCQKISFGANEQFGLNFGQNYANLYLFKMLQNDGTHYIDISYGRHFFHKNLLLE